MEPKDFVYQQIYTGALREGANEFRARDQAVIGLDDYKKGDFDKASKMIQMRIKEAVKESKK